MNESDFQIIRIIFVFKEMTILQHENRFLTVLCIKGLKNNMLESRCLKYYHYWKPPANFLFLFSFCCTEMSDILNLVFLNVVKN